MSTTITTTRAEAAAARCQDNAGALLALKIKSSDELKPLDCSAVCLICRDKPGVKKKKNKVGEKSTVHADSCSFCQSAHV